MIKIKPGTFHDGIKPGSFRPTTGHSLIDNLEQRTQQTPENEIVFYSNLEMIHKAFRDQVYNPRSVLYPSCGFDATPGRVYENVTFIDIEDGNTGCVQKLQEAGFHAIKQDIKTYVPKKLHDLLILFNPGIPTEWASRHLMVGGYILADEWHNNPTEMYNAPDQFMLWGIINHKNTKQGGVVEISRDLTDLFQPISPEELKKLRPEYKRSAQVYIFKKTS